MRWTLPALAAAALLALAGCGAPPDPPQSFGVPPAASPPTTSSAPPAQTPAELELYGPRVELPGGLLLKQLGKVVEYTPVSAARGDDWTHRVVLDRIEVDPKSCQSVFGPERAHRLVLHLRVETSEHFDRNAGDDGPAFYRWSIIGPDGVSEGSAGSEPTCRSTESLPIELRPSAKYRGQVSIDTAHPVGRLVLDNGAVWDYPAATQ